MPTTSIGFVNGRISVKRRHQLTAVQVERLRTASGMEEAMRILGEIGWAGSDTAGQDYEQVAALHLQEACAFVRENSPASDVTDCFLIRYDIENLKMLLKARTLGVEPRVLSGCGIFGVDALRHAVNEGVYHRILPDELAVPLDALEKRLAVQVDAMDIDVTLDKAMYALIFTKTKAAPSAVRQYFTAQVDFANALALLRFVRMGKSLCEWEGVYLEGGSVPLHGLRNAYEKPESLARLYGSYGRTMWHAVEQAQDSGALAVLEKAVDDYLLSLFLPYQFQPSRLEGIVGYLLQQQREVAAVRLVLAAESAGFSDEAVTERLRDLYA